MVFNFTLVKWMALSEEGRAQVIDQLKSIMGAKEKVKLLLHSIAWENLKLIAPEKPSAEGHESAIKDFATALGGTS